MTKMISQLEKLIHKRDKTIARQNAIIDELFILVCEHLSNEELDGITPLIEQIGEISK